MTRPAPPEPGDPGEFRPGDAAPEPSDDPGLGDGDDGRSGRSPGASRRRLWIRVAIGVGVLTAAGIAFQAYRSHKERRVVALSVERARQLLRSDTWLGDHEAAALLGARAVQLSPVEAGSWRALALARLALDYRDAQAAEDAAATLVQPLRADQIPPAAALARVTLALRGGEVGTAVAQLAEAEPGTDTHLLQARVAVVAGKADVAAEAVGRALQADPSSPAALALRGDLARRASRPDEAREAYAAALAGSAQAVTAGLAGSTARPGATAPHPRATFGLAKLALSRELPAEQATRPLERLLADRAGTPQVERARAALYLAALRARAGDRAGAAAALDQAGVDGGLHAWLERAAGRLEVERGRYRVPEGTPSVLVSASDDDPYVPPPPSPKLEPGPPRQALHGFKVHTVDKKKPVRGGTAAKRAKKKPGVQRPRTR